MGASGAGALIGLSNVLSKRLDEMHERNLAMQDEQRKGKVAILTNAINSGNLSPEQIDAAMGEMSKLYPKEAQPMIQKWGEVVGRITHLRGKQNAAQPDATAQAAQPTAPTLGPAQSSVDTLNANNAASTPGRIPQSSIDTLNSNNAAAGAPSSAGNVAPASQVAPGTASTSSASPDVSAIPPTSPMASILAAANPGPVARAKTAAQAQLAGNDVIQADRKQRANRIIQDMKDSGVWTPQAETALRMEAEGFSVPSTLTRQPLTGKQLQPDVRDGVLLGVKDPINNEYYTDPKTMPAEAKDIWDRTTDQLAQKQQREIDKEQRTFGYQMTRQEKAFNNALAASDYRAAKKAVNASQDTVDDAIDRMKTMDKNLVDLVTTTNAGHPNQQAALSLVANHIGMTLGLQKGARITKSVWDEAQQSAPWLSRVGAKWSSDGFLTGLNITPEQGKQMVMLAHERVGTIRERAQRIQDRYADDIGHAVPPKMQPKPATPAAKQKIVVTADDMKNAGAQ